MIQLWRERERINFNYLIIKSYAQKIETKLSKSSDTQHNAKRMKGKIRTLIIVDIEKRDDAVDIDTD